MKNKDLRVKIEKIREAQTIITNQINLIYNEVSDLIEKQDDIKVCEKCGQKSDNYSLLCPISPSDQHKWKKQDGTK